MNGFEIVAMAASAGGLNALTRVLGGLPREFPVAIRSCSTSIPGTAR